jgi:hypothetical protein
MINAPLLLAGAATGTGLAIVVAGLRPAPPDLAAALRRLDSSLANPQSSTSDTPLTRHDNGLASRLATPVARWMAVRDANRDHAQRLSLGMLRHAVDLQLLGESVEHLLVRKLSYGLVGLAFPPLVATVMAVIGLRLPWPIPAAVAVVLAAVLFMVPDLDVRQRANAVRHELRRATGVYLELVALERAADAGASEALDRAATIGVTPAFERIQDALTRARLAGEPAWQGLTRLGEQSGVTELADIADIMRLSGQDGAAVYATLRARATSLRTAQIAEATASANAASEHMVIPVGVLGLVFLGLVGFPAFARIVFGP